MTSTDIVAAHHARAAAGLPEKLIASRRSVTVVTFP